MEACSAYTVGFLWSSSGLGQAVGIPVALISAIAAIALKCLSCCLKREADNFNQKALNAFVICVSALVTAIPVVGGMIFVYWLRKNERQRFDETL